MRELTFAAICGAVFLLIGLTAHAQGTSVYWGDAHLQTNISGDAFFLGNRTADPDTVDIATANYTNSIGDSQLATVWSDLEFDPKETWRPPTIQDRAYTSPIWYTP